MLCPVCGKTKDNPTWETCRSRECGDTNRRYNKLKITGIDIRDIENQLQSNKKKIQVLQREVARLIYIKKLYVNTTVSKKKLVKLLRKGCPKEGMCLILGISMRRLECMLASS